MAFRRPVRRAGDRYEIRLSAGERAALRGLFDELRDLLVAENPASDAAVARLFPPAYPEDPLRNLDYERGAGNELLARRLEVLETVAATIDARDLAEEHLLAWLGAINDARLVLGTRLDVTEESTENEFADDESARATYQLYLFLSWLEGQIVDALSTD